MRFSPILLTALGLALGQGCAPPPLEETPVVFPVATPVPTRVEIERAWVGEVWALQRAEIPARTEGLLEEVAVAEGMQVEEGQLLFRLSPADLDHAFRKARAAVSSASAALRAAQLEHETTQLLFEREVVSEVELSMVAAKVALAAAQLEEAEAARAQAALERSRSEIRAPFAGVVGRFHKRRGAHVEAGEQLTTLTNADEVFVDFRVAEGETLSADGRADGLLSAPVGLLLANGARAPLEGRVEAVSSEVDRATGTVTYRARFENRDGLLRHGSTGTVIQRTTLEEVLTIPKAATFEVQDQRYVYVVDAEGRARTRRIETSLRTPEAFVIASGIEQGERYLTGGVQRVRDGQPIRVQAVSANAQSARR